MPDEIMPVNVPRKLAEKFRAAGGRYHRLADQLGVNVGHVYNLIKKGIEPKSPDIRVKMFLPKHPHKAYKPRAPKTSTQKAIHTMTKDTRNAIKTAFQPKSPSARARH